FCGGHVCSGTLARDQDIEGLPCLAQTDALFSVATGRLTQCTLARPLFQQSATGQPGRSLTYLTRPEAMRLPREPRQSRSLDCRSIQGWFVRYTPEGASVNWSAALRSQSQTWALRWETSYSNCRGTLTAPTLIISRRTGRSRVV